MSAFKFQNEDFNLNVMNPRWSFTKVCSIYVNLNLMLSSINSFWNHLVNLNQTEMVLYQLILKPFSKFESNWDGSLSDLYLRTPSSNWLRCLHIFSYKPDHQFGHNMVGITCLFSGIISISRWPLGQLLDWHVHLFFSLITEQIWYEGHMIAFSIFWHIWHLTR
jgi:hypothetical protein